MATKRWADLSSGSRRMIIAAAGVEAGLKIAALVDLARRPRSEIRGRKVWWAAGIVLVNALGVAPAVYFMFGRRH